MSNKLKLIFPFLFIFISEISFSQTDSNVLTEVNFIMLLEKEAECRVKYDSDSIMKIVAKSDAEKSFNSKFPVYYRIGHAGGVDISRMEKLFFERYHIILKYTHCTPCLYQVSYSKTFEYLFEKKEHKILNYLISSMENRLAY